MLKRYVVFTGRKDQVQSGLNSIHSDHDTLEAAVAAGAVLTGHRPEWDDPSYDGDFDENDHRLWVQVVDTDTMTAVKEMGYEVP